MAYVQTVHWITEKTAMLPLYRRHSEKCPVHKLKLTPAAERKYMDCECPRWIYGNTETTHVPVKARDRTSLQWQRRKDRRF